MSLTTARGRPLARSDTVAYGAAALAAITVAAGLLIKATSGALGTPLPPFLFAWGPAAEPLAIVSAVAFAAAVLFAPRLLTSVRSPLAFAACVYVLAVALGLSLNLAHDGARGWWSVFAGGPQGSHESAYEYLPGLPALAHGTRYYFGHFAQLFPYLPLHAQGNPPGPLVALHLLGISTPGALAALCVATGALTAPLAYDLGRTLSGEQRGRTAAVLTSFTPSLLLFGVTSADYAFAAIGMAVACLLARRSTAAIAAGCALAAIGSLFSWLLLAIPAWAALLMLARDGWRPAIVRAAGCLVAISAVNTALALAFGYDPFAALRATSAVYRHVSVARPYAYWAVGSPVAWALMLGIPTAWFALRATVERDPAAVALAAVIAISAILGFTKAETERIWLPFAPLACVAAAAVLPIRSVRSVLPVLALQALAVELLFITIW